MKNKKLLQKKPKSRSVTTALVTTFSFTSIFAGIYETYNFIKKMFKKRKR